MRIYRSRGNNLSATNCFQFQNFMFILLGILYNVIAITPWFLCKKRLAWIGSISNWFCQWLKNGDIIRNFVWRLLQQKKNIQKCRECQKTHAIKGAALRTMIFRRVYHKITISFRACFECQLILNLSFLSQEFLMQSISFSNFSFAAA